MSEKRSVAVYGAGKRAMDLFPLLLEEYNIVAVFDRTQGDSGKKLYGVDIVKPNRRNVNEYPVVIAVADINSCVSTLKSNGCQRAMYACVPYLHGFAVFACNDGNSIAATLENCRVVLKRKPFSLSVRQTSMKKVSSKRKYFILGACDEVAFFSATGGPAAGLRFLWEANEHFRLIDNVYAIMRGLIFTPQGTILHKTVINNPKSVKLLPEGIGAVPVITNYNAINFYVNIDALKTFLENVGEMVGFSSTDVFLCLDAWIAYAFMKSFPAYHNVALAYHSQGVLSEELGKTRPELCEAYDCMQREQMLHIKEWIFPTRGAADGFLSSANDEIRRVAKACHFNVLYSSYEPKERISPDADFVEAMDVLQDYDVMFASATFLYKNKGVERIPRILALFKKQTGLRIKWVLIGTGEMEDEVRKNIDACLESNDYIWYNKRFDNQDNVFELFERADFYIMMHRISVSDLSTLQAMAYGCVPFLSNVGGNLEFCGFDNGILVDPQTETLDLGKFFVNGQLDRKYLAEQKRRNQKIIRERFNEKQFLQGYRDFLYAM